MARPQAAHPIVPDRPPARANRCDRGLLAGLVARERTDRHAALARGGVADAAGDRTVVARLAAAAGDRRRVVDSDSAADIAAADAAAGLALGPPAAIIELARPRWHEAGGELADPRGGMARWQAADLSRGRWQLGDGHQLDDARPCGTFSPDGRWFATQPADERGLLLLDRERNRLHRLRGWKLCGWHTEPWLMRSGRAEPMPLREVLGQLRQWWS
jgi:hypothetical protein